MLNAYVLISERISNTPYAKDFLPSASLIVEGSTEQSLKEKLPEIIMDTLRHYNYPSNNYLIGINFHEDGMYLHSEEPAEYHCNLKENTMILIKH